LKSKSPFFANTQFWFWKNHNKKFAFHNSILLYFVLPCFTLPCIICSCRNAKMSINMKRALFAQFDSTVPKALNRLCASVQFSCIGVDSVIILTFVPRQWT
jgi:hypothetical protein